MGKKNKKIKKICPHCGQRNKFGKNNWNGADKTKCKYCRKILANIKEYELPITKLKSDKKEVNFSGKKVPDSELMALVSPTAHFGKKKSPVKKKLTLAFLVIVFVFAAGFIFDYWEDIKLDKSSNLSDLKPPTASQELCKEIKGVPSWAQDGRIIDEGYKPEWDVAYLIENKITFLYSSSCGNCHKQISDFGDQWGMYVLSGYTNECW